jgi:putative component of membrane protein insertase Oxa1/YidC/SpoIIIJ protein YidD
MRILKFKLIFNLLLISACSLAQEIKLQKSLVINPFNRAEINTYQGVHGFYKKYISSQDGSNCQFHPSCSHFAKLAIQKYPLPIGLFLSADRLLRCNGRKEGYVINSLNKAIDLP